MTTPPKPAPGAPRASSPWRDRDVMLFAVAICLGLTGLSALFLVLPWLTLSLTGDDAASAGVVLFMYGIPLGVVGFLSGPLLDRLRPRRILVHSAIWRAGVLLALFGLGATDRLTLPILAVGSFVVGILMAPGPGAIGAFVPALVQGYARRQGREMTDEDLERVSAVHQSIASLSNIAGPSVGAFLIHAFGPTNALAPIALSVLASGVLYALVRDDAGRTHAARAAAGAAGYARDLGRGLAFLWRHPFLRRYAPFVMGAYAVTGAAMNVVLPTYVKTAFSDALVLGAISTALGAGMAAGALFYARVGEGKFLGAWLPLRLAAPVAFLVLAALTQTLVLLYASAFLWGLLLNPLYIVLVARQYAVTPEPLRGRVAATLWSLVSLGTPLANLVAGVAAERYGPRVVLAGLGVGLLLVSAPFAASPRVRATLREAEPAPAVAPAPPPVSAVAVTTAPSPKPAKARSPEARRERGRRRKHRKARMRRR